MLIEDFTASTHIGKVNLINFDKDKTSSLSYCSHTDDRKSSAIDNLHTIPSLSIQPNFKHFHNENIKNFSRNFPTLWKHQKHHRYDNLFQASQKIHHGNFSFPPRAFSFIFLRFPSHHRRHILSFNLALFILFRFGFVFSFMRGRERSRAMDRNHARHYPTPKLLRLLCFMGNAITFISSVVKIYFFLSCLSLEKRKAKQLFLLTA